MLTGAARRRRMLAAVAVVALVVAGTFVGQDDHFPFGPHRMFSTRNELNGRVNSALLRFKFADGTARPVVIDPHTVGLRRAEVEGQQDRFMARPRLLSHLAETYETLYPETPPVVAVRLFDVVIKLEGGRPTGTPVEETLAKWER